MAFQLAQNWRRDQMTIRPFAFLVRRRSVNTLAFAALVAVYIATTILLFFLWVDPSLDGRSAQHIAADSSTYLSFAKSLKEGANDPLVLAALTAFPSNLWTTIAEAYVLESTFLMVLANYAMFFLSVHLFRRTFPISGGLLLALLLLNLTTTISLLSVNKEMFDMLAVAIFCYAQHAGRKKLLAFALLLALVNRYEVFVVMLVFLVAKSRWTPLKNRRLLTLVFLTLVISVVLPLFGASALANRAEEASGGGLITWMDGLEMHYLYFVAVIPKIAENLIGELFSFSKWVAYGATDPANSYIVWGNNLANAIVIFIVLYKRSLTLKSDVIYFAAIGSIMMAIALVVQPRYFYFVYVLLCIEASKKSNRDSVTYGSSAVVFEAPLYG